MRVWEILNEDDAEHQRALDRTGFWGAAGAGCLIIARDTGRICIAHRSQEVEQPGTWGTWGGAIDQGEDPKIAAAREVQEEAGYHGKMSLIPLYIFSHPSGFKYYNFLAVVDREFTPQLDWETQGFVWVEFGDWPQPLHHGLVSLLSDVNSVNTIKQVVSKFTDK